MIWIKNHPLFQLNTTANYAQYFLMNAIFCLVLSINALILKFNHTFFNWLRNVWGNKESFFSDLLYTNCSCPSNDIRYLLDIIHIILKLFNVNQTAAKMYDELI